jgi:hypothetical protein
VSIALFCGKVMLKSSKAVYGNVVYFVTPELR